MYKIHHDGRMKADLFGSDLEELKRRVEEQYSDFLERMRKDGEVREIFWEHVGNKWRYYYTCVCLNYNISFKQCLETIIEIV